MPEELIIILVILIGAIWLLVKICQAIAASFDHATKSYSEAAARRKENRYVKGRDRLRQFVHALIPNELDRFEKKFEVARIEFDQAQELTNWIACPACMEKRGISTAHSAAQK